MPNRFERALENRQQETAGATREFREFDPRSAARESARAGFEAVEEDIREGMEDIRGRQVGAGRLRTGFGMQDQDRFIRDRLDRLNRTLAQNAVNLAGMRQDQLGSAAQMQGQNLRVLRREDMREDRNRAGMLGALGSALGGGAGLIAGGPAGAAAGASIGGGAGRGIAGLF